MYFLNLEVRTVGHGNSFKNIQAMDLTACAVISVHGHCVLPSFIYHNQLVRLVNVSEGIPH